MNKSREERYKGENSINSSYKGKGENSINSEWEYNIPTKLMQPKPDKSLPPFSYPSIMVSEVEEIPDSNSNSLTTQNPFLPPQISFLNLNKQEKQLVLHTHQQGKQNKAPLQTKNEIQVIVQAREDPSKITIGQRMISWLLALLSGLFVSILYFMIKLLIDDYNFSPIEQIFIRGYYFSLISTVGMYVNKCSILELTVKERNVSYFRTVLLCSLHMFMFYFLDYLSVTIFTLIFLSYTIFTPIWSRIILKEAFSNIYFIFLTLSIIGLFFLLQPTFIFGGEGEENTSNVMFYIAIFGTLLAAIGRASGMVVVKTINSSVNPFTLNLFVGPISTLAAGLIWYVILKKSSDFGLVGLLLIGITHSIFFLSDTLVYLSLRFEQPSIIALICYSQILFTYIAELLFYELEMGVYDLIGAIILASSTFGLLIYNYLSQKRLVA